MQDLQGQAAGFPSSSNHGPGKPGPPAFLSVVLGLDGAVCLRPPPRSSCIPGRAGRGPHTHSPGTGPGLRPSWRPWGQGRAGPGERKDGGEGREGGAGDWTATRRAGVGPGSGDSDTKGPLLPPQGPEASRRRPGWSWRGGSCKQPQGPGRGGRSLASWRSGGSCAHFWK